MIELWVLGLALAAMLSVLWGTLRSGISPMPSSAKARDAILDLLPGELEGEILELGSGWGGLAFSLAKRCPQASVRGYETSLLPWLFSVVRLRVSGVENLSFHRRDFRELDFSVGQVLVCYLYPGAMSVLAEALGGKLPEGGLLISNTFALPGWKPRQLLELNDLYRTRVYCYGGAEQET